MNVNECYCGARGWYFEEGISTSQYEDFLKKLILISYKFGINLSAHSKSNDFTCFQNTDLLVKEIFDFVGSSEGDKLQKAINYNFYSIDKKSRALPSVLYSIKNSKWECETYNDTESTLFCTLKESRFYSLYYELRTDAFIQLDEANDLVYLNMARFNSYIRSMHQLMENHNCSLFESATFDISPLFKVSEEGYFFYKGDCVFYEDVYELLPDEKKYGPFNEVQI